MDLASTPPIIWQSPEAQPASDWKRQIECSKAWQQFVRRNPVKPDGNVQALHNRFMDGCIRSQEAGN